MDLSSTSSSGLSGNGTMNVVFYIILVPYPQQNVSLLEYVYYTGANVGVGSCLVAQSKTMDSI